MRLIDADALQYRKALYDGKDAVLFVQLEDVNAAPTVTPTVKVRYDEDAQEWTNVDAVVLEAVTDGFWNTPVVLHLGAHVLERRTP